MPIRVTGFYNVVVTQVHSSLCKAETSPHIAASKTLMHLPVFFATIASEKTSEMKANHSRTLGERTA